MTDNIDWAAIHAGLTAPFAAKDVKTKPGRGGDKVSYVDARTVAERLDSVVGPANWHFDWIPMIMTEDAIHVVKGTLTIHGISKSDIGDSEKIEPNKGAVSDALKRAAVLWGIGRYLYGSGAAEPTPQAQQARQQPQERRNGAEAPSPAPRPANGARPPAETRQAFATDAQQTQIRDLVGAAGMTMDALLDKLDITRLGLLPAEGVDDVIARLQARIDARRARAGHTPAAQMQALVNVP